MNKPRFLLISLVLVSHVLVFGLARLLSMKIDFEPLLYLYGLIIVVFGSGILYASLRNMHPLRTALECVAYGFILTVPAAIATYLAIKVNMPLADEALVRMDAALHFDWHAFIRFMDEARLLAMSLAAAYFSFSFQLLGIPLLLVMLGRGPRAYAMVASYGLICFVASVISIWYPAFGTYVVYGVSQEQLSHINAEFGFYFLQQFNAVRSDPDFVFSINRLAGILTFPSVHAAVAALCAWTMWDVKWLRYPFAVWNSMMAISAVSHANHYLVDVIAGVGVAGLVIAVVSMICGSQLTRAHTRSIFKGPLPVSSIH